MKNKGLFSFGPARLIFFGGLDEAGHTEDKPKSQKPAPMGPQTQEGVAIDAGTTALSESKELSPEESRELRTLRIKMTKVIEGIPPLKGSKEDMKKKVKEALQHIPISSVVNTVLDTKLKNPQHVYTIYTGTHFVEIELVSRNEDPANTEVSVYEEDDVPEDKHDVKDTKTFLDWKANAIQILKGVKTRKEIYKAGNPLLADIKETVSEENSKYPSNHILSVQIENEVVDIRVFRDKNDEIHILILPWKG